MSVGSRILSKYQRRLAQEDVSRRTGRADLQFIDFEVESPRKAHILIKYHPGIGYPRTAQIHEWVRQAFNGLIQVDSREVLNYPDEKVILAAVRPAGATLSLKYADKMLLAGRNRYAATDRTIWEVQETEGQRHLVRVSSEDLKDILGEKMRRMKVGSLHHAVKIRNLITAGISNPSVGDQVEFWDTSGGADARKFGTVTTVGAENVTISVGSQSVTTDRTNLIAVVKESAQSKQERDQYEIEFYEKAYGDKAFARKLVKG